jgi:hypothetical protein
MPYVIRKVIRYGCGKEDTPVVKDVTAEYFQGTVPSCDPSEHLEYHTLFKNKSYRIVSTPQSKLEPTLKLFQKPKTMNDPLKNPRIISATLCQKFENEQSDASSLVFEYAGPNHDFFGQSLKTRWLFPKMTNSPITSMDEETTLHVMYSNGVSTHFSPDEYIKKF